MYKSVFIYDCNMYRWNEYRYVSTCAIGCYLHDVLLADCLLSVVCTCVGAIHI